MKETPPRAPERSEASPRNEKVHAIVLNWNGLEDTLRCVEGLLALEPPVPHVSTAPREARMLRRESIAV